VWTIKKDTQSSLSDAIVSILKALLKSQLKKLKYSYSIIKFSLILFKYIICIKGKYCEIELDVHTHVRMHAHRNTKLIFARCLCYILQENTLFARFNPSWVIYNILDLRFYDQCPYTPVYVVYDIFYNHSFHLLLF
jgi:hypothetical protein